VAKVLYDPAKMAIAVGMGLLQAAIVAAQPVPYAEGGWVENYKIIRAGERGREWIASNRLVTDPRTGPIIAQLDRWQRSGAWQAPQLAAPTAASAGAAVSAAPMPQPGTQRVQVEARAYIAPWELERYNREVEALKNLSKF
jgi:hypothetical protein